MKSAHWPFSLLLLFTAVAECTGVPSNRPTPVRVPLTFEALPDGKLMARQGPHEVTLAAGRITTTILDAAAGRRASVTSTLIGADPRVRPQGADPLPARANYILGTDPAQWRPGVPLFGRAVYRGLYPGVDLVFHGTAGSMEYDYLVQPGASISPIAFQISGASALRLEPDGGLSISTAAGEIRWLKPEVYQTVDGVRREIAGRFVRRGRRVSFALGPYDHSRSLVLDPVLTYLTYFGGSNDEATRGITVDALGNIYITGSTLSNNLPTASGVFQSAYHGAGISGLALGGDAFIAKFTPGGALAYVTYIGGSVDDGGTAIAVDASGNAYITGYTDSRDFPTVQGSFQTTYKGAGGNKWYGSIGDAFVAKLNAAGSALVYSTYLGGSLDDRGTAIAVDSAGNAYVGGVTLSTDFPTKNAYQNTYKGGGGSPAYCCGDPSPFLSFGDGFLAKLNPAGTALVFSTYFGGSLDDAVTSLAVDSAGNVYMGGSTLSTDFPVLSAYQPHFGGAANAAVQPDLAMGDGWVAKFDYTGNLMYSTYLGGSSDDAVMGLAIDGTGAVYVTGFTSSANFPISQNAAQRTFAGPSALAGYRQFLWGDAFAAKLSPSGSLVYSTFIGGSADDAGMAIAVDSAGNAYVGGMTASTNFPITGKTALQTIFGGASTGVANPTGDGFLSQINPDGSTVLFSTYFGGLLDDAVTSIALDAEGNVYLAGTTASANLPVTKNAAQSTFGGALAPPASLGDGFVAVISGVAAAAPTPLLSISKKHTGNFTQGQNGAAYTVTVSNGTGAGATSGTVTVTETPPAGMTLVSMAGTGWTCPSGANACTRSDSLAAGSSYPAITVMVNVASNAASQVTNQAAVSGGGSPNASASDATAIGAAGPTISLVANAEGENPVIAPNTWVEVKGTNLAPAGDSRIWQGSDFVNNKMPTGLDGVSVTVNGKAAYIYYISPTQVNILTPPDAMSGAVQVQVTNNGAASAAFTAQAQAESPSFFVFNGVPYVAATHADGSYLGPASLYPGYTTPAKPGEEVVIYANGFGPTSVPVVSGAVTQSGTLLPLPVVTIGGLPATVAFAGLNVAPGEFQFNVVVPPSLPSGDQPIMATYNGLTTQAGALITVQQ